MSQLSGTATVAQGGTGATDANTARANLTAAKSGANSDITALSGLTTALTTAQGGTGLTSSGAVGNILISNGTTWTSAAPNVLNGNYVDLTSNQTVAGTKSFTGTVDASNATATIPIKAVAGSLPASCTASKELVIKIDATPGQQIFVCNSTGNGWILQGDGLGSGGVVFNQVVILANKMTLTKNACSATYSTPAAYPQQNAGEDLPIPAISGQLTPTSTVVISPVSTLANTMPTGWTSYTYYPYVDTNGNAFVHVCNPTQFNASTSGQITFNVRAIN